MQRHYQVFTVGYPNAVLDESYPSVISPSKNLHQSTGMRRFSGMGVAWFFAAVVAVTIAAAAVGSVRSEVTDVATALGVSASRAIAAADERSDVPNDGSDLERTTTSTPASGVEAETPESATTETTTEHVVTRESRTRQEKVAETLPQSRSASPASRAPAAQPFTTSTPITPTTSANSGTTIIVQPTHQQRQQFLLRMRTRE
jgi:hypothetical protein